MNKISYPICGSENISNNFEDYQYKSFDGNESYVKLIINYCISCGEKGDFNEENDHIIKYISELQRASIEIKSINNLENKRIKKSFIERKIGLQQGTILKWVKEWERGNYFVRIPGLLIFIEKYDILKKSHDFEVKDEDN